MFSEFPNKPLIVYLDQNKWIDLAKASVGHKEGQKYKTALEKISLAAKQEKAIFPLSIQHFIETRKKRNLKKRKELANVMAEISQGIAMVPKNYIMGWEIEQAIAITFNKSTKPRPPIFGYGLSLLFGRDFIEQEIIKHSPQNSAFLRKRAKAVLTSKDSTISFLIGDDEELNAKLINGLTQINESFMERMERSRREVKNISEHMQKIIYMAILTKELQQQIIRALNTYGKTKDDFFALGRSKGINFFQNIPTLDVEIELATCLDKQWSRKLKTNDTHDIGFLSKAIPYCDVIVTENLLKSMIAQKELDKKYKTTVYSNLNDLIPIMESL